MKKKLLSLTTVLLCVAILGSAIIAAVPAMRSAILQTPLDDNDGLASADLTSSSFDTSIPAAIVSFGDANIADYIKNTNRVTYEVNSASQYTSITLSDSGANMQLDTSNLTTAGPIVAVGYRTSKFTGGKLDLRLSSTGTSNLKASTFAATLSVDGQWHQAILDTTGDTKFQGDSVTFFRLNFTDSAANDIIDLTYVAFFATAADAQNFNYTEYLAYMDYTTNREPWPEPTYTAMTNTLNDYNTGSVTYTPSADGSNMTISYKVNGSTVSYTVPNDKNYLSGGFGGTDDLGRELYDSEDVGVYGTKGERYVGLFYFLLHGAEESGGHNTSKVYNLQYILDTAADPKDVANYGEQGISKWFAEPLYGYYIGGDAWVMRKHAELLCNANIDFIFFDATNGFDYSANALVMMRILHDMNEQGFDAPQVLFYTNTSSASMVSEIYTDVYQAHPELSDTWFRLDGKPVIVATGITNTTHKNFFTIKESQWPTKTNKTNGWPWMDFSANGVAQSVIAGSDGRDAISVSAAQHQATICFSESSLFGGNDRGRSYSPTLYSSITAYRNAWSVNKNLTKNGANFQWQWDNAHATDAEIVLVTGWNEWIADLKYPTGTNGGLGEYAYADHAPGFVDCASMEYSRDLEMMAFYDPDGDGVDNGYFDNYYMQLVQNVEKRLGDAPVIVQDTRKPINVTGSFDQWDDIKVTYSDMKGDTADRNYAGFGTNADNSAVRYTDTTGRNDIVAAKVTSDAKNLYFYVETADQIKYSDRTGSWMQLFIDIDNNPNTGWYGYDYIANYDHTNDFVTTLYKHNGATKTTYSFTKVCDIRYRVKDNMMMIEVPQSQVGINGTFLELNMQFKWADSESEITTMQQFYTEGDAAPLGRLNFIYQNYIPGKSVITYPTGGDTIVTETESTEVTEPETTATEPETTATEPETTEPTEPDVTDSLTNATVAATGAPVTNWRYAGQLLTINGVASGAAVGYRDISNSTIHPATINGASWTSSTFTLTGWALSNGGQSKIIWSLDGNIWYDCPSVTYGTASTEQQTTAVSYGTLTSTSLAKGTFSALTIDLSSKAGQTVNLYLAVLPASSGTSICHFATIQNLTVGQPVSYVAPADTSVPLKSPTSANMSICADAFYLNGSSLVTSVANSYLSSINHTITDTNGFNTSMAFYGWTNTGSANIAAFGYEINGMLIWTNTKTHGYVVDNGVGGTVTVTAANSPNNIAPDSGLSTAGDGTQYANAKRHLIEVDLASLPAGTYNITPVMKTTDGHVVALDTWGTIKYIKWGPSTSTVTPAINAAQVMLGNDLSISFYTSLPTVAPVQGVWAIRVTMNGNVTYIPVSQGCLSNISTNEYSFLYTGITPQCMGDTITVELVAYNASTGSSVGSAYASLSDYSVKKNLTNLQATYASDAKLMALIADTLKYGAAAQTYVGYKTDSLVTSGVNTSAGSAANPGAADNIYSVTASNGSTYFKGCSVYYDYGVNRLCFAYTTNAANVTVSINGVAYTPAFDGTTYTVMTEALSSLEFDKVHTVTLSVDGVVVQTLTYSVNAYAYRMAGNGNANAALALALYRYGISAEAYAA